MSKNLVAIDLPPLAAAEKVAEVWGNGDAAVVIPPAATRRSEIMASVRPTHLVDVSGTTAMDGDAVDDAICAVVATSGTTGSPRAVELTRDGMHHMATNYVAELGLAAGSSWLCVVPLWSVAGLAILARAFVTGIDPRVIERFSPGEVAASGADVVSVVPTMLHRMVEAGVPLDGIGRFVVGGAPLPERLRREAAARGARIAVSYGMTETWGGFALDGVPLPGMEVRVGDESEIQVRGPQVMARYRSDEAATRNAFVDGWFRTRDSGTWDGERLEVAARVDDIIIVGGVNVAPRAIVDALLAQGGVVDVHVHSEQDPEWGRRVVADVVIRDTVDLDELKKAAATGISPAAVQVRIVDSIVRNEAGKVERALD